MKRLFLSIFVVALIAGCGIFGNDGSDKFGAWEKVSADRGEYRGIGDSKGKVQMISKSNGYSTSADTIQIDTSYVNSEQELSISITPHLSSDADHDFYVTIIDSTPPNHNSYNLSVNYVTDSTAISFTGVTKGGQNNSRLRVEALMKNNCAGSQADEEHLVFSFGVKISNCDSYC
jgi:hypothetical protein